MIRSGMSPYQPILNEAAVIITDNELIGRFLNSSDESAFEELVRRHSKLVMGVCRSLLFSQHDAEDAFQATFVVLSKKAKSLLSYGSIGGWLYQVAVRNCLQIRRRKGKDRETVMVDEPHIDASEPWESISKAQELELMCREIDRLPKQYRDVIVLCHLEGRSRAEAAEMLDRTEVAVKALLSRGRNLLRRRLTRNGLVASSILALMRDSIVNAGQVDDQLIHATIAICQGSPPPVAVGTSSEFVQLIAKQGVYSMQTMTMLKSISLATIFVAGILVPLCVLAQQTDLTEPIQTVEASIQNDSLRDHPPLEITNSGAKTTADPKDNFAAKEPKLNNSVAVSNHQKAAGAFSIENSEEYWELKLRSLEVKLQQHEYADRLASSGTVGKVELLGKKADALETRAKMIECTLNLQRIKYEKEHKLSPGSMRPNSSQNTQLPFEVSSRPTLTTTPTPRPEPTPIPDPYEPLASPPKANADVQPGEKLLVEFTQNTFEDRIVVVTSDYKISLPFAGVIDVRASSPDEIAKILNKSFSEYIRDPEIFVARLRMSSPYTKSSK